MKTRDASGICAVSARVAFSCVALAAAAVVGEVHAQSTSCYGVPAAPTPPTSGYIDVRTYGATPNDDADDTAALQKAIDAALPGQWVRFPAGRYLISNVLLVKTAGVTLWSDGATLHGTNPDFRSVMLRADRTRIYGFTLTSVGTKRTYTPQSNPISATNEGLGVPYLSGIVIQNNRIVPAAVPAGSPSGNAGAGIFVFGVRDFTVAGNEVRRTFADGIHITAGSRNGRVVRNKVYQTGDDMIAVVSYIPRQWYPNYLANPASLDAELAGNLVRNVWVAENTVSDQYWGRGMSVVGGDGITFARNQVSKTTAAGGIFIGRESEAGGADSGTTGVRNVLVEGNTVTDVLTTKPGFMTPDEGARIYIEGHRAVDFGGIEVHALMGAADLQAFADNKALAMSVVGIQRITFRNNIINRTAKESLRTGVWNTPKGAIADVTWANNQVSAWGKVAPTQPYAMLDGLQPTCVRSAWLSSQPLPPTCSTGPAAPVATGATLDCSRFPAP